jgi:hypothetical protein
MSHRGARIPLHAFFGILRHGLRCGLKSNQGEQQSQKDKPSHL